MSSQQPTKKDRPTVDTCWHVVVITATVIFMSTSFERATSFLYIALMDEFGVDRQTASWPISTMLGLGGVIGLFVGMLQKRFQIRDIMLVGSVLTWVGVLASGLATSTEWLILTIGVIQSTGFGTMNVTMKYFAMMYFDKLRGIAMGITSLGLTIASFTYPKIMLFLRDTYGFHNSLFLLGAFTINITPLSYLLKEPRWYHPTNQYKPRESDRQLGSMGSKEQSVHQQERQRITSSVQTWPKFSWEISSLIHAPIFYVVVLSTAVSNVFESLFLTSMTDFCQDKGLTETDAVWLTSCFNLTELLGRLCVPLLADKGLLRRSTLLMTLHLLLASVIMSAPCSATYWSLAAIEAFAAILVSSASVMHDVVAVDYFGLERLPTVYGIIGILKAPLQLCNPLILGFFRDRTGSYEDMYRCLAGVLFFLSVVWLTIVCCERRELACVSTLRSQDACTSKNGHKDITSAAITEESHM